MALSLEGAGPLGNVSRSGPRLQELIPGQGAFGIEIGGKLNPTAFLGGFLVAGFGSEGSQFRSACQASFVSGCTTADVVLGVLLRLQASPGAARSPWIALGTGVEILDTASYDAFTNAEVARSTLTGWQMARLSVGLDFRLNPIVGLGVYVLGAVGTFSHVEGSLAPALDGARRAHGWVGAGVRTTLFP
jgi:hypothetical protein